jgi:prevent-host-death family protein
MTVIRPISDLRNHFNEIEEICHKDGEPVFITKNGKGSLVVMSMELYEKQRSSLELYNLLCIAEEQSAARSKRIPHAEVIKRLRARSDD